MNQREDHFLKIVTSVFAFSLSKLTNETFTALYHTTYAFLQMTKYDPEELKMA